MRSLDWTGCKGEPRKTGATWLWHPLSYNSWQQASAPGKSDRYKRPNTFGEARLVLRLGKAEVSPGELAFTLTPRFAGLRLAGSRVGFVRIGLALFGKCSTSTTGVAKCLCFDIAYAKPILKP